MAERNHSIASFFMKQTSAPKREDAGGATKKVSFAVCTSPSTIALARTVRPMLHAHACAGSVERTLPATPAPGCALFARRRLLVAAEMALHPSGLGLPFSSDENNNTAVATGRHLVGFLAIQEA